MVTLSAISATMLSRHLRKHGKSNGGHVNKRNEFALDEG